MSKRHNIITAAITVFARDGLEKGKIADIATEAGIGKGTIYEYFSSKEALFQAIETHVMDHLFTTVFSAAERAGSAEEKLKIIFEVSIREMGHMGNALLIVTEIMLQTARGHVFKNGPLSSLNDMYTRYREAVEAILQEGIDNGEFRPLNPPGAATLFLAFIDGIIWQYIVMQDNPSFQNTLRDSLESYLRGIRK